MSTCEAVGTRDVALVDLIDRLMTGGVVLAGDLTLAIADIDLVLVQLRAMIGSVEPEETGDGAAPPTLAR